jgi:hypothetical protein
MSTPLFREVDCRQNAGITTTLLLAPETGELYVTVVDRARPADNDVILRIPRHQAADAFRHPYAYARS